MSGWLITLIIIGAVLLPITLILLLRVNITIIYNTELRVMLRVLFYKKQLYPKLKKRVKPSDFTYKKILSKRRRAERKAAKKFAKKVKKAASKEGKEKEGLAFSDVPTLLDTIRQISGVLLRTFFRHIKIRIIKINIAVACSDAAQTAIAYGAAAQSLAYLLEFFDNIAKVKYESNSEVNVVPDFLSEHFSADIEIVFTLRVIHLLDISIKTAYNYLKGKQTLKATKNDQVKE